MSEPNITLVSSPLLLHPSTTSLKLIPSPSLLATAQSPPTLKPLPQSSWKSQVFSKIRDNRSHINIDDETNSFLLRGSLDSPAILRAYQSNGAIEQLSVKEKALYALLTKSVVNLSNIADANMAIYIMRKQVKNEMEMAYMQRVLENISVFKQHPTLMTNEIASSSLFKQLKHEFYPRRTVLFNFGDYGSKYYILLKGSASCLLPQFTINEDSTTKPPETESPNKPQSTPSPVASQDESPTRNEHKNAGEHESIAGKFVKVINQAQAQQRTVQMLESIGARKEFLETLKEEQAESDEDFLKRRFPTFKKVRRYTSGDSFGEIALLTNKGRSATIVCDEDSHFVSLTKDGFDKIFGDYKKKIVDDQVNFLTSFWFFKSLPKYALLQLMYSLKTFTYTFRQSIYKETEPVQSIYLLKQGEVEISQKISKNGNNTGNISPLKKQKPHEQLPVAERVLLNNSISQEELLRRGTVAPKRVIISKLGDYSYFGEHEIIHKIDLRQTQAVCASLSCEIISVEKQKLRQLLSSSDYNVLISSSKSKENLQTERLQNSLLLRSSTTALLRRIPNSTVDMTQQQQLLQPIQQIVYKPVTRTESTPRTAVPMRRSRSPKVLQIQDPLIFEKPKAKRTLIRRKQQINSMASPNGSSTNKSMQNLYAKTPTNDAANLQIRINTLVDIPSISSPKIKRQQSLHPIEQQQQQQSQSSSLLLPPTLVLTSSVSSRDNPGSTSNSNSGAAPPLKSRLMIRNLIDRIHYSTSATSSISQISSDSSNAKSNNNSNNVTPQNAKKSKDITSISQFAQYSARAQQSPRKIHVPNQPQPASTPRQFPMNMFSHSISSASVFSNSTSNISHSQIRLKPSETSIERSRQNLPASEQLLGTGIFRQSSIERKTITTQSTLDMNRLNQSLSLFQSQIIVTTDASTPGGSAIAGSLVSPKLNSMNSIKFKFSSSSPQQQSQTLPQVQPLQQQQQQQYSPRRINPFFFNRC